MANTLIDEHEEKAMCCWYLLLNHAIPEKSKQMTIAKSPMIFPMNK